MLEHTFIHFPGVGKVREARLWEAGITTWSELERAPYHSLHLGRSYAECINESRRALEDGDAEYFASRLPRAELYRVALAFPRDTLFLDIESTGLSHYYDYITIIGWAVGDHTGVWVRGEDLGELAAALSGAKAIITFNGALFDLPFLRRELPELRLPACHIDLRFLGRRVGLRGGQKIIEDLLGLQRAPELTHLRGDAAPVLWHRYCWGETTALELLVNYNQSDVVGLQFIWSEVAARLQESGRVPSFVTSSRRSTATHAERATPRIRVTPPQPTGGQRITLEHLKLPPSLQVVGIDLTGSERRPSGWCLLDGQTAYTQRIQSDDEIIRATVAAKPDLVSIDSPLSLPRGRVTVTDDDPARATAGIMRECERILKRRGINVYPCLLPSMQQLTARGIRLASALRSRGLPVIESYPGAAQDILAIPRKGVSEEFLAKGLVRFGIDGDFVSTAKSHDELDAITSALVGAFFWAGRFEALGNFDEDFLIVPDISTAANKWVAKRVVGFSGPIASGKTTAAHYLASKGYSYARYSDVLRQLSSYSESNHRASLQEFGQHVRVTKGQRWLGRLLLASVQNAESIVIDGLRHPEDHALLVESFGPRFSHVAIVTPKDIRMRRAVTRDGDGPWQEASSHPVEENAEAIAALAHEVIYNYDALATFLGAVMAVTTGPMEAEKTPIESLTVRQKFACR